MHQEHLGEQYFLDSQPFWVSALCGEVGATRVFMYIMKGRRHGPAYDGLSKLEGAFVPLHPSWSLLLSF